MPYKFKKSAWSTVLSANNNKIPYGTLATIENEWAKPVTTSSTASNVKGIVFHTIDFEGSMSPTSNADDATEVGSVFMHGNVYENQVKFDETNGAIEKAALNKIIFVE